MLLRISFDTFIVFDECGPLCVLYVVGAPPSLGAGAGEGVHGLLGPADHARGQPNLGEPLPTCLTNSTGETTKKQNNNSNKKQKKYDPAVTKVFFNYY